MAVEANKQNDEAEIQGIVSLAKGGEKEEEREKRKLKSLQVVK
jgi:hypothetical protein